MSTHTSRQTHCLRTTSQNKCIVKSRSKKQVEAWQRSGLTLVEIMIALTMTLIVLGAMAQAFKFASGEIAQGRAILEMSNRLRNAEQLLRTDLAGLTVDVRPHIERQPNGYFEYVEGEDTDSTAVGTADGYLGDADDILAFTSRNLDGTFRGRVNIGGTRDIIQSAFAEIVWFTVETDLNSDGTTENLAGNVNYDDTISLYRRVLLIRPELDLLPLDTGNYIYIDDDGDGEADVDPLTDPAFQMAIQFFINNDISARWIDSDGDGNRDQIVANSLSDLGPRENRFGRDSTRFPHEFFDDNVPLPRLDIHLARQGAANINNGTISFDYSGDDILLTDVAGFDLKVYSPNAEINLVDIDSNLSYETYVDPSDIGFEPDTVQLPMNALLAANGAFVDLGYADGAFDRLAFFFSTDPNISDGAAATGSYEWGDPTFCSWSPHYESDGIDQDGDGLTDEGTNGIDDAVNGSTGNGVDDDGEKETSPPYPFPVRGMKVTFRIIEKNTKQLRQTSVIQNFLPQ